MEQVTPLIEAIILEDQENQALDGEFLAALRQASVLSVIFDESFEDLKMSSHLYMEYKNKANALLQAIQRCSAQLSQTKDLLSGLKPILGILLPKAQSKYEWVKKVKEKRQSQKSAIVSKVTLHESELQDATKADIESFKKLLFKKTHELNKLQKELLELKECEKQASDKRETLEKEIEMANVQKAQFAAQLNTQDQKEWQELEREEQEQQSEIGKIEAILCDNVDRCLGMFLSRPREESTRLEDVEAGIKECYELMIELRGKNAGKIIEASYILRTKGEMKRLADKIYSNRLLQQSYTGLKKEVEEQKFKKQEVATEIPMMEESVKKISKEEMKTRVENLLKESAKPEPVPEAECETLEATYQQMLTECVSSAAVHRVVKKSSASKGQIQSHRESIDKKHSLQDTLTNANARKDKSCFGHSNFSYIFPSTYTERAPFIVPVVNEGLPLSSQQSPEQLDEISKKKRRTGKVSADAEDSSGFIPLTVTGTNKRKQKGRRRTKKVGK